MRVQSRFYIEQVLKKTGQILPANVGDPAHILGQALSVYKHINAPENPPNSGEGIEGASTGDNQTECHGSTPASTQSTSDVKLSSTADVDCVLAGVA